MGNNSSNPNIEWKKSGFDEQEKLTLKTNVAKAAEYEAKKDNITGSKPLRPTDLPVGLKKIRKKSKTFLMKTRMKMKAHSLSWIRVCRKCPTVRF